MSSPSPKKSVDPLVADIRERVADLVKVPMYLAEDMQVLHYRSLSISVLRVAVLVKVPTYLAEDMQELLGRPQHIPGLITFHFPTFCFTARRSTIGHIMTTLTPTYTGASSRPLARTASSPSFFTSLTWRRGGRQSFRLPTATIGV